jgi:hypothetical protein
MVYRCVFGVDWSWRAIEKSGNGERGRSKKIAKSSTLFTIKVGINYLQVKLMSCLCT